MRPALIAASACLFLLLLIASVLVSTGALGRSVATSAVLTAVLIAYGIGSWRGYRSQYGPLVRPAQSLAFLAGLAALGIAFLPPLDLLGSRSFAAHMTQHLIVIIIAAPLLAASDAHRVLAEAVPPDWRRQMAGSSMMHFLSEWRRSPAAGWSVAAFFAGMIAFWHVPALHDAALERSWIHGLEQASVAVAAILFWRVVLTSGRWRVSRGAAAFMVALVGLEGVLISAILMFAAHPLCSSYVANPMQDQIFAGLLMCIPASFAYAGSTIWALARIIGGERLTSNRASAKEAMPTGSRRLR